MSASLDLEVTRKCNLRCDYCFVGWSRDWTSEMPAAVAHEIVREGSGLFPALLITGGEAFSYRSLFALLEAALDLEYREVLINTNGTLITPEIAERLSAYGSRLHITVSVDGPERLHDPVRGPGRFRQAARGIDLLLAAGVRVTVYTVVTPSVLGSLPYFLPDLFAAHPGIAGATLFPVGVGPEGTQKPGAALHPLTPGELRELALVVALLFRAGYNVGVAAYPIVNPLLLALGYPRERLYQCTAGRGRVCVHADLTVSTCHPVKEPIYGRWSPGLFRRLPEFAGHRRMAERDFDGCRTCPLQETCGHCRAYVTASGADLYGNDRICQEVLPPVIGDFQVRGELPDLLYRPATASEVGT